MGDYKKAGGFGGKKSGGFRDRNDRGGRPSYGGGRPSFGGGRPSFNRSNRDDAPREMFQAVCDDCRKSCQVPFRPTGDKPVYCSNCFGSHRVGEDRGDRGRREDRGSQDRFPRREFPSAPRRDFAPSFVPKVSVGDKRIDEIKKQLDVMSAKVDTIFRIVSGKTLVATPPENKIKKEVDETSVQASLKSMMADAQGSQKKSTKKSTKKTDNKEKKEDVSKKVEKKVKKKVAKKVSKKVSKKEVTPKKK